MDTVEVVWIQYTYKAEKEHKWNTDSNYILQIYDRDITDLRQRQQWDSSLLTDALLKLEEPPLQCNMLLTGPTHGKTA